MSASRTLTSLVLVAAAAATVDAAPLAGFALKAESAHFSFYARGDEKVEPAKVEDDLARVEHLLGQPLRGHADYYRYETPEELSATTGTYAAGLTLPTQIHSTRSRHPHEIVHLLATQIGDPGRFFQEGLAVALGDEGRWNGKSVDALAKHDSRRVRVAGLIAGFDRMDPEVAYPLAGSFVAGLIRTHSLPKVVEFFRACHGGNTETAFAQVFGLSLEQAEAAWASKL